MGSKEDAYFYLFSRGRWLEYLGMAYRQSVRREILQTLLAFQLEARGLSVWVGDIVESDFGRITEQIVRDVECLLVITHRPILNTQCTKSYRGRDNLMVENRGCPLLRSCVKVEGGRIYRACQ